MSDGLPAMCLCFLLRDSATGTRQVLLGEKLRGLGTGRVVGLGGHIEAGETAAEAAIREVAEESGLCVSAAALTYAAFITFQFPDEPTWSQTATVFTADRFTGTLRACDEIVAEWHEVAALPVDRMWGDARHWLRRVLAGEQLGAGFTFAADLRTVLPERIVFSPLPTLATPGQSPASTDT